MVLAVDLETHSSVDLRKCGVFRYTQAEDFEILLFGYAFGDEEVQVIDLAQGEDIPKEIMEALTDPNILKHAFNAAFERTCLAKHFGTPMPSEQWRCSQAHALTLGLPSSLKNVAEVLKLENQKMDEGRALIRYFCNPCKPTKANGGRTRNLPHHDPEKWYLFKTYCKQDVVVERDIRKKLDRYPMQELKLWFLDQKINDYGIRIDTKLVKNAIECDKMHQEKLMKEAIHLTGLENPNSPAQLKAWLEDEHNIKVDSLAKAKVEELLNETDNPEVKRMLGLRQEMSRTSVRKYEAMDRAVCKDERVRGLLQYYGASTGRWAGRILNPQNLPRNNMSGLDAARSLLRAGEYETLELLFDSVPDVLSQLIRTAIVPSPGHRFIVSDFSSIEARIVAWLAGEQWVVDVFNDHGKIYEMTASRMFRVPFEKIVKGNPEYEYRQKGKLATLSCSYQGSVGALKSLGALDMGLKEKELKPLVDAWRVANPNIVKLWWAVEAAAITAVRERKVVSMQYGLTFYYESGILFIRLPSGRSLAYVKPRIETDERFNKDKLTYEGIELGNKWGRIDTYGGKLTENCLAADTIVLTSNGWKPIIRVEKKDLLWDGVEWVEHEGVISKGLSETINIDGVRMTEDHLVLTEKGWKDASSCKRYKRAKVKLPNSYKVCRFRWEKITVADPLRLWKRVYNACIRIFKRKTEILWMHGRGINKTIKNNTWNVKTSGICCMEIYDRQMQISNSPGVEKLRWARNKGMRQMASKFPELLGRYGPKLSRRSDLRKSRCEWALYSPKLRVGNIQATSTKQKVPENCRQPLREDVRCGIVRENGDWGNNSSLSDKQQLAKGEVAGETRFYEQVYDILDSGKRNRFTVLGNGGAFIVHNCVQAIARDCLAESLLRLDAAGYKIATHIHDEVVLDVPHGFGSLEEVEAIMSEPIDWAPGLPMGADGFESDYYKKD